QVSVTEALIRLRAYAFTSDRLLTDVAEDVVAHRLRLECTRHLWRGDRPLLAWMARPGPDPAPAGRHGRLGPQEEASRDRPRCRPGSAPRPPCRGGCGRRPAAPRPGSASPAPRCTRATSSAPGPSPTSRAAASSCIAPPPKPSA